MTDSEIRKAEGLVVVEVRESNINGDPDTDGAPRMFPDDRSWYADVSFKRKMRDHVLDNTPVWAALRKKLGISDQQHKEAFRILEDPNRPSIAELAKFIADAGVDAFNARYWDARIFGNTFLEENENKQKKSKPETTNGKAERKNAHVRTGVLQFGKGVTVAPCVLNTPATCTKMAAVQDDKDRGMAPSRIKDIAHGVYAMPFFVNPCAAVHTKCSVLDIKCALGLIPEVYTHCASTARPDCRIIHAYYVEFTDILGVGAIDVSGSLRPIKKNNPEEPSKSLSEYEFPGFDNPVLKKYSKMIHRAVDLCESPIWSL